MAGAKLRLRDFPDFKRPASDGLRRRQDCSPHEPEDDRYVPLLSRKTDQNQISGVRFFIHLKAMLGDVSDQDFGVAAFESENLAH